VKAAVRREKDEVEGKDKVNRKDTVEGKDRVNQKDTVNAEKAAADRVKN
jgi:hypothetical protein